MIDRMRTIIRRARGNTRGHRGADAAICGGAKHPAARPERSL